MSYVAQRLKLMRYLKNCGCLDCMYLYHKLEDKYNMPTESTIRQVSALKNLIDRGMIVYNHRLKKCPNRINLAKFGYHEVKNSYVLLVQDENGTIDGYEQIRGQETVIAHTRHGTNTPNGRVSQYSSIDALIDIAFDLIYERGAHLMIMHRGYAATLGDWWVNNREGVLAKLDNGGADSKDHETK